MKLDTPAMRVFALLVLMLIPLVSLQSQEPRGSDDDPQVASGFVFEHRLSKTKNNFARQDPTQSTDTDEDYVFPSAEHRRNRYFRSLVGPFAIGRVAASAGLAQWSDSPEEWGQGAEGYGKRFASQFGRNVIRQSVTYGLSEALRLDTGFEKSKRKGFWPRLSDALVQNVTSRTRSGNRVISAPILAGAYTAAIIPAETWYPSRYSYKDGLRSGTYSIATGFGINVVREFLFNW